MGEPGENCFTETKGIKHFKKEMINMNLEGNLGLRFWQLESHETAAGAASAHCLRTKATLQLYLNKKTE